MWDQHPMMKDWECMTDILLEAPDQEEDRKLFDNVKRRSINMKIKFLFKHSMINMKIV